MGLQVQLCVEVIIIIIKILDKKSNRVEVFVVARWRRRRKKKEVRLDANRRCFSLADIGLHDVMVM